MKSNSEGATPGSIEEISAGPQGPEVAAFFDLDGTLINGFSALQLVKDRLNTKDLHRRELGQIVAVGLYAAVGRAAFEDLLKIGADVWAGRLDADLHVMGERIFREKIINLIYPEMKRRIRAHQQAGHTVVLASSATIYQVQSVARHLNIEHVLCNRFTTEDGVLTGEIEQPVIWGKTKAGVAQEFAWQAGIDLRNCYFYADGSEDIAFMLMVGYPRPTNPQKKLTAVAETRGWPIQRYHSRRMNGNLRTAAGIASVVPIGVLGLGIGLINRDKRAALNYAGPLWLDALLQINRVKLNVVGRDNLWKQRPAVFIFNHRNNFDALMVARLVERDFTAVGKKELQDHWLTGSLGKLADVIFIDRSSTGSSIGAIKQILAVVRKGLSITISPEGTRHDTETIGSFKTGAFRMAMVTGLPIVPVVFRNAESVAARDSMQLAPGTVDVAVLPPIDISDWTSRTVAERMEEVRELYIDALENWPTEEDLTA